MPDLEEAIEKKLEKSKFGRWLRMVGAMIVLPLLGFLARQAWNTYEAFNGLQDEVQLLKANAANNQAIWNSISENRNRTNELKVEVEVMKRLFDREFARGGNEKPSLPKQPDVQRSLEFPKILPPVEPDKFREEQEQKFPPPQRQYKK